MSRRDEVFTVLHAFNHYEFLTSDDRERYAEFVGRIMKIFPEALPIDTEDAEGIARSIRDVTDNIDIANAGSHK